MKKLLLFAAVAFAAVTCQKSDIETPEQESGELIEVTVTAGVPSTLETRMGVVPDEINDNWAITWDNGDSVIGWSESGSISEFEMSSYDSEESTFTGSIESGNMRLIYPYDATAIQSEVYTIDLSEQSVDLTTDAHAHYGKNNLYMASDIFAASETASAVNMSHLLAAVELEVTNSTGDDLIIEKAIITGLKSSATVAFRDLALTSTEGDITLSINSAKVIDASSSTLVPFSVIPETLSSGDTFTIELYFTNFTTATITKTVGSDGFELAAGTHNTFVCEVEETTTITVDGSWSDNAADSFAEGAYSSSTTSYTIETADQFAYLSNLVNDDGYTMSGMTFTLANDIDLSAHEWVAIGYYPSDYSSSFSFQGTFDGGGYKVSGLYINQLSSDYQGLFGSIYGATIKDVSVSGTVSGDENVGGVVGQAYYSSVTNCYNSGSVSGSTYRLGGVVGTSHSTSVTNCYNSGSVSGSSYVGGVVGLFSSSYSSYSSVTNCDNSGSVSGRSYDVGGVVGYSGTSSGSVYSTYVTNCYNSGSVSGNQSVGGVVGYSQLHNHVTGCIYDSSVYTGNAVGTNYYGTTTDTYGIDDYAATMQSDEFVETLNKNANTYNNDNSDAVQACGWAATSGYPTLYFESTPNSDGTVTAPTN